MTEQQDKKEIYIGPTIQHIQNCEFLLKTQNKLLLRNKRQLLLLNLDTQSITSSKLESEKVIHYTFHEQLEIFLIKTENFISAVNIQGESLGKINFDDQIQLNESRLIYLLVMKNDNTGQPNQKMAKIIYITDQNMHISDLKIQFQRGMLKNKQISKINMKLIKKKNKVAHIKESIVMDALDWIQKCKIFKEEGFFVSYNKTQLMVLKLPQYQQDQFMPYLIYQKITKIQNKIADLTLSIRQKIIILSYESGAIKIYAFNDSKKYLQQLRGHQKQCHTLFISKKNKSDLLYSSGLDNTVRIWNLINYCEIYSLRIDIVSDRIILLSDELAFIKFDNFRKCCLCSINAYKMEPIIIQNKGGKLISLKCDGEWAIALYSNNYAEMFLISNESKEDQNFQKLMQASDDEIKHILKKPKFFSQKIQFPLKYGNLKSSFKIRKNQYAIIMDKGFSLVTLNKDQVKQQNFQLKKLVYNQSIDQIQSQSQSQYENDNFQTTSEAQMDKKYNLKQEKQVISFQKQKQSKRSDARFIQLIHQKLLGTFLFSIVEDWKNIPTAIKVTYITFVTGKSIPKWDLQHKKKSQKVQDKNKFQIRKRGSSLWQREKQSVHIVIGTQKGAIYFLDIQNRLQYESRTIFHSSNVDLIKQFKPYQSDPGSSNRNNQIFFVSMDSHKEICFWSLSENHPPNIYTKVHNQKNISLIGVFNDLFLIGQKQGRVSVFQIILQNVTDSEFKESPSLMSPPISPTLKSKIKYDQFKYRTTKVLYFKQSKNQSHYGHMKGVYAGDYVNYYDRDIFITGSEDCVIKMWRGLQKELLFQIKIFDPIIRLRFSHCKINFYIAHNDQISCIKSENIQQLNRIQQNLKKNNVKTYGFQFKSIKSFFIGSQQKYQKQKFSNLRLKKKYSNKIQPLIFGQFKSQKIQQKNKQQVHTPSKQKRYVSFLANIHQQDQIMHLTNHFQSEKQQKFDFLSSPSQKKSSQQQKLRKRNHLVRSQDRIKLKKSFHIQSTNNSKDDEKLLLMLPKLSVSNQKANQTKSILSQRKRMSEFRDTSEFSLQKLKQHGKYFSQVAKKGL